MLYALHSSLSYEAPSNRRFWGWGINDTNNYLL